MDNRLLSLGLRRDGGTLHGQELPAGYTLEREQMPMGIRTPQGDRIELTGVRSVELATTRTPVPVARR